MIIILIIINLYTLFILFNTHTHTLNNNVFICYSSFITAHLASCFHHKPPQTSGVCLSPLCVCVCVCVCVSIISVLYLL